MIRLGIVDFDTSHAVEFTRRFNHVGVTPDQYVTGARVVMGYPGTSLMAPQRIEQFRPQVAACGVELVDDPASMLGKIDAVLITSLCGAAHLNRARMFLEAGVPTFIDKPFTTNWADAQALVDLSIQYKTLLWHASAMRFTQEIAELQTSLQRIGPLHGVLSFGPAWHGVGNPGLLHYGIHAAEQLFALMGPGCVGLSTLSTSETDVITGQWRDHRIGTLRGGRRGHTAYGVTLFAEQGVLHCLVSTQFAYRNLCQAISDAFTTGHAPVPLTETLEVMQFLLAANASAEQAGAPVELAAMTTIATTST